MTFSRFYETYPSLEEQLESEDPGMRAVARYMLLANKHREFRAEGPPTVDFVAWEIWWAEEKKLDRETFEAELE